VTFRLEYQIGIAGGDQMRRVLRGVEAEVKASKSRAEKTTSRTAVTSADRELRARERAEAALNRQRSAAMYRQHQQALRDARREEQERTRGIRRVYEEEKRAHRRALNEVDRNRRRAEGVQARSAGSRARLVGGAITRGAGNAISGLARFAGGAAAIAGGVGAASALNEEIQVRAAASRLANQAGNPALKGELAAQAKGVRGFTGTEVLSGIEEFVTKTGDLETARQIIGDMGTLALATGTDLGDLGATAGQAFNVLRDQISDPVERVRELNSLMGVLAVQGAMGAVEIRDLATDFGKLGAATRAFEGGGSGLMRTMGAFAQLAVARGGAESSADASTAASRLASDIVTNRKKFKGLGVDIKSKSDPTKLRDPVEIIADVLQKTGGDIEKTSGLFGMESKKIFAGLSPVFAEAEKKQKGSGRAAVLAEVSRFAGVSSDPAEFQARAESRLQDEDMRLKETAKRFNDAIGTRLIPALTEAIPHFERAIPALANFTDSVVDVGSWLAENPWKGLGLLVGGAIVKELAAAGIGSLVSQLLTTGVVPAIGGAAAGAGGAATAAGAGAAAAGFGGKLARVGMIGAVVAAGATALSHLDDASSLGRSGDMARDARADLLSGKLSQGQQQDRLKQLQGALATEQASSPGLMMQASGAVSSALGGMSADEMKQDNIAALRAAIDALTASLREQSGAASGAALAMNDAARKLSTVPNPAANLPMLAR